MQKSNLYFASTYSAEIIGGLLANHILCTLDNVIPQSTTGVQIYCDNLGVAHHAQRPSLLLSKKQAQSDILSVFIQNFM